MGGSAGLEIALGFLVAMIIFTLWAWWMVRDEREAREVGLVATPHGNLLQLPVSEPPHQFIDVSAGSVCHVAGSIGFTPSGEALVCTPSVRRVQPRWRRFQIAA
jgi:hypothetical protein